MIHLARDTCVRVAVELQSIQARILELAFEMSYAEAIAEQEGIPFDGAAVRASALVACQGVEGMANSLRERVGEIRKSDRYKEWHLENYGAPAQGMF